MDGNKRPPFDQETFDKIILDPPCSALGQRPQLQCKSTAANLESYPVYQKKLLEQVIRRCFFLSPFTANSCLFSEGIQF